MYKGPESPQSIGAVLDSGFSLYRHSLKGTFLFAFLGNLVPAAAGRIMQPTPDDPVIDLGLFAVVLGAVFVLSLLLFPPIVAKIHAVQHGESLTAGEAMAVSLRRLPAVLGVTLLLSVGFGVGAVLLGPFLAELPLNLGIVLLLTVVFYFGVKVAFAWIAAIVESKGVFASLRYSLTLVRGRWWRTAILLTVVGIVAVVLSVVYLVVAVVFGVFIGLGTDGTIETLQRMLWPVELIIAPALGGLLTPLIYALVMAIYADLKLRSEGADIANRIAAAEA